MAMDWGMRIDAVENAQNLNEIATLHRQCLSAIQGLATIALTGGSAHDVGTSVDNIVVQVKAPSTGLASWSFRIKFNDTVTIDRRMPVIRALLAVTVRYPLVSIVTNLTFVEGNGDFEVSCDLY